MKEFGNNKQPEIGKPTWVCQVIIIICLESSEEKIPSKQFGKCWINLPVLRAQQPQRLGDICIKQETHN